MTPVYDAENSLDAHLVRHVLEAAGIRAHVFGEALAGGIGELPAGGLVRVCVDDHDVPAALAAVRAWAALPVPDAEELDGLADDSSADGFLRA